MIGKARDRIGRKQEEKSTILQKQNKKKEKSTIFLWGVLSVPQGSEPPIPRPRAVRSGQTSVHVRAIYYMHRQKAFLHHVGGPRRKKTKNSVVASR